jgi:hypothetical protein
MIFQSDIQSIDSEINQLLAQIEAKKQRQSQLTELDTLTDSTLGQLGHIVSKIGDYAPSAIASLKSAVLTLFDSGDNGNDGGNQPTNPTPQPDDDEPELKSLNGETGDCLTTADPLNKPHPHKAELDGRAYEWATPFASPLTCLLWEDAQRLGQHCQLTSHWEHDWELEPLDGQAWEIATPLCCLLSDAPKHNEDKGTDKAEYRAYIELVSHPENKAIAYQRKHDSEIVCVYVGCNNRDRLRSWGEWVYRQEWGLSRQQTYNVRPAKRLTIFKHELKLPALPLDKINALAAQDYSRQPVMPTEKLQPTPSPSPKIKIGHKVIQSLTPSETFEATSEPVGNGTFFAVSLLDGRRQLLKVDAVTVVEKAPERGITCRMSHQDRNPHAGEAHAWNVPPSDRELTATATC